MIKRTQRINKTKSWFFEKINKIEKPLAKLSKRKKTQINKIRDKKGDITTNTSETQGSIREYFEKVTI
jgi:putative heme iron utilization protein